MDLGGFYLYHLGLHNTSQHERKWCLLARERLCVRDGCAVGDLCVITGLAEGGCAILLFVIALSTGRESQAQPELWLWLYLTFYTVSPNVRWPQYGAG